MRSLARVLGCLGVAVLGIVFAVAVVEETEPAEPFSSERWAALPDADRELVVDDLLERRLLIGLNEEEVRSLLGEPSEAQTSQKEDLAYLIGTEWGRVEFLLIRLHEERVDSAWTWWPVP